MRWARGLSRSRLVQSKRRRSLLSFAFRFAGALVEASLARTGIFTFVDRMALLVGVLNIIVHSTCSPAKRKRTKKQRKSLHCGLQRWFPSMVHVILPPSNKYYGVGQGCTKMLPTSAVCCALQVCFALFARSMRQLEIVVQFDSHE